MHAFRSYIFAARIACDSGPTCSSLKLFLPDFLTGALPYTFYFGVKFYAADPCKLFEENTRYFLICYLQKSVSFEHSACS